MTANLKRFDPAGADGSPVIVSGTVLSNVILSGAGSATYEADAGAGRGAGIGVEVQGTSSDIASLVLTTDVAAAGSAQLYANFKAFPSSGYAEFFGLRSQSGNALRIELSSTGAIGVFDANGGGITNMAPVSLDTWYRFDLACTPDTPTTGSGSVKIFDDDDTLFDSWSSSVEDFGSDKSIYLARAGDVSASGGDLHMWLTQLALDTASTPPTIDPVPKNTPPPTVTGNFPYVWNGTTWS